MATHEVIEALAEYSHSAWAGWTEWMMDKWDDAHSGGEPFQQRWIRQVGTPYRDLSDEEKESDRVEARRILATIRKLGFTVVKVVSPRDA